MSCVGIALSSRVVVVWCCCVVIVVRRRVASWLRVGVSSSRILAVSLCRGLRVVHLCCRLVGPNDGRCRSSSGCQLGRLERVCHDSPKRNDERRPMSSFVVWLPRRHQRRGTWILHGRSHPLVVVWVRERPLAFIGGGVRCTSLWALGTVWWLSSAASLCGGCGG